MPHLLLACALCLIGGTLSLHADLTLTRDGQPLGVIVHNGHTQLAPQIPAKPLGVQADITQPAIEDLQAYLRQITGAQLPLVASLAEAGDRPAIVFELVDHLPGASTTDTGWQAYRIHTQGNRLHLTASTLLGLHNAVFGLLEDHLGCHFYSYKLEARSHGVRLYNGPGHEVIPQHPTLTIPQIDDFREPALASRGLIFRMGGFPWILKNRAIGVGDHVSGALASGHSMYQWIPPQDTKVRINRKPVDIPGLMPTHPEFFPMDKAGERSPDMHNQGVCGTAKALPAYLAQRIIDSLHGKPANHDDFLKIGQGDGFQGCHCDDCRTLVREQGSEAAPLIHMFNETLDIVQHNFPNIKIITFCYFNSLEAPESMRVHDNLWINVVSSARSKNSAGDQMGPILNNPANADYARALKEWPQRAPGRVTVWHWDTYRAEWPSMFYIDDNLRYMVECGVYGVNPQTCGGPWDQLINWLYMKLNWDPQLDGDALIRQYLEDAYGHAAAPYVYDYLDTGRNAYEAALHVPSAVRWTGWTRLTMDKLFPDHVRAQLVALMDQAVAEARESSTPDQLANLLQARRDSIDVLVLEAARHLGEWDYVKHGDTFWYVAGGDPRVPAIVERRLAAGTNAWQQAQLMREAGGPVHRLQRESIGAIVSPAVEGQLIQAHVGPRALLDAGAAEAGYADTFPRKAFHRAWHLLHSDPQTLTVAASLSPRKITEGTQLTRTIRLRDGALEVTRTFTGDPSLAAPFSARWRLALPHPQKSRITVSGGGIKELMDLRYAQPGGIRTIQAGQRPPGYEGLDAMDEKWDAVQAVSDAQIVELAITDSTSDLQILLDRGDGLATIVTTPAAGWSAIHIKPVVGEHYLELLLIGQPAESDSIEELALPVQRLTTRQLPEGEAIANPQAEQPQPRIRRTGETTAINEVDGAELVWVPAGTFTRGSNNDVAGADEQPVRQIHLDGYWVYKYPVTVGQYKAFCEATGRDFTPPWPQNMKVQPEADPDTYAVTTNWFQARDYARWAGGSLPTEAQWEKAARGTDARQFPWGNTWQPDHCVSMENTLYDFNEGFRPVGSHPAGATPYGAMDMAGNVWEWVADWYRYDAYTDSSDTNPTGPAIGANKVVRGGCSLYDWRFNRTTARFAIPPAVDNWTAVGFRITLPPQD